MGTRGSVSVYFIAVLAGLMLATFLLIDLSRAAAFRLQAELAVKSGVRSVMSAYDPVLYESFGLFARGGDAAGPLFRQALEGNLSGGSAGEGTFSLLRGQWDETEIAESRPLGQHDVLKRQVLEDMKYKAPIDLAVEVGARFRGMHGAVRETAATVGALERMRQAYERRERALDDAAAMQRQAGAAIVRAFAPLLRAPPATVAAERPLGTVRTAEDAAEMYGDYTAKRQADRRRALDGEPAQHAGETAAYEAETAALAERIQAARETAAAEARLALETAQRAVEEAAAVNRDMSRMAEEASALQVTPDEEPTAAGDLGPIRELRSQLDVVVLDDDYFAAYRAELERQLSDGGRVLDDAARFAALASAVASPADPDGHAGAMARGAALWASSWSDYKLAYDEQTGAVLSARQASLEAHRGTDAERRRLEREAEASMAEATAYLQAIRGASALPQHVEAFRQVERWAEENLRRNAAEPETPRGQAGGDASARRDEALRSAEGWLEELQEAAAGARDRLYHSEYVAGRFRYADPSAIRRLLQGETSVLALERQEAEYILYGFTQPAANAAAAYGEVFAARLAIRTVEGLIESRSYGHPLLVLAAALVYGVRHALADLRALIERGKIELSKYVRVDTAYSDYLRLFLLLHGGSSAQLARMVAVVRHRTGVDPDRAYTYVSGEGKASTTLWFFPGVARMLGRTGLLGGTVNGGRYEVVYSADYAYQ